MRRLRNFDRRFSIGGEPNTPISDMERLSQAHQIDSNYPIALFVGHGSACGEMNWALYGPSHYSL